MTEAQQDAMFGATAECYASATILDRDLPSGGFAPQTPKLLMKNALLTGQPPDAFGTALDAMTARRQA